MRKRLRRTFLVLLLLAAAVLGAIRVAPGYMLKKELAQATQCVFSVEYCIPSYKSGAQASELSYPQYRGSIEGRVVDRNCIMSLKAGDLPMVECYIDKYTLLWDVWPLIDNVVKSYTETTSETTKRVINGLLNKINVSELILSGNQIMDLVNLVSAESEDEVSALLNYPRLLYNRMSLVLDGDFVPTVKPKNLQLDAASSGVVFFRSKADNSVMFGVYGRPAASGRIYVVLNDDIGRSEFLVHYQMASSAEHVVMPEYTVSETTFDVVKSLVGLLPKIATVVAFFNGLG